MQGMEDIPDWRNLGNFELTREPLLEVMVER